jgi:pSer/pThr/pTyr-binding forkhead associated (FHA) protein
MPSKSRLRVQVPEQDADTATLQGYDFTLRTGRSEVRASSRVRHADWETYQQTKTEVRDRVHNLVGAPKPDWPQLVQALQPLLPAPISDHLQQSASIIQLQCDNANDPWELLPDLAAQAFVTRVNATPVRILGAAAEEQPPRVLVAHSAHNLSPWSKNEVRAVESALGSPFEVRFRSGKEVTKKQILRALTEGFFSVVHMIVYLTPQGVVLHDGILRWDQIERLSGDSRPRMMVIHAVTDTQKPLLECSTKLATALLTSGVPAVLVSGWNPQPAQAVALTEKLYGASSKTPVWESLKDAAQSGFLAFGNWDFSLDEAYAVKIETAQNAPTAQGTWQADFQLTVLEGPEKGSEIPLFAAALDGGRKITIGRPGPVSVDLAIEDECMDNHTASLEKETGNLVLSNLTGQPDKVKVNGLPVAGSVTLQGCDEIRLGTATCVRIEPVSLGEDNDFNLMPPSKRYALKVSKGTEQDRKQRLALDARVVMLGRQSDCALMLNDMEISRHHAILVPKEGTFFVGQVGNAQVVVNGFPLKREHRLKHGDSIQLSPTTVLDFIDIKKEA